MAKRLQGKVALITGGARGLGAAAARLFAHHGAKIIITDIRPELGQSLSKEIESESGQPVTYIQCDVTSESDVQNAVDAAVSAHGKLDIMYCSAAIAGAKGIEPASISLINHDVFRDLFDVNVYGSMLAAKHAARVMVPQKSGTILLTSSFTTASHGMAPYIYVAAKHAVVGVAKNLAVELGKFGIRVNCISPYGVATPMVTEMGGMNAEVYEDIFEKIANLKGVVCKDKDIAEVALNLVSDESRYVSGVDLMVDGGFHLRSAWSGHDQ
ncbi:Short chain aldehyde dehydrogenase 1 [Linum perenne]